MMVGRNDPCPCGSGKKYKKCCLGRERVVPLSEGRRDRAGRSLLVELREYCLAVPAAELARARLHFFPVGLPDEEITANEYHAWVDWLAFGHRTAMTGERIISKFAAGRSAPSERALLAAWAQTRPGLYEVAGTEGELTLLRDCFTGDEFRVDLSASAPPGRNALLEGRLLPIGEVCRAGYTLDESTTALLPQLRPLLEAELERMRRAEPEAGWDDLFRKRWPVVRDMLMLAATALEGDAPLRLPPAIPGQSLGLTSPPDDAPPGWTAVADAAQQCLAAYAPEFALIGQESVVQLWWDAAAAMTPRTLRPESWAAGLVYTWLHRVCEVNVTQAEIAAAFSVSVSTVGARSRDIVGALAIEPRDDRYVDPLSPVVRAARLIAYVAPPVAEALNDPIRAFGVAHPAALAKAQELVGECQALFDRGDIQAVRRNCVAALRACPVFVPARNNLALCYMLQGDARTAIDVAEIGLRTHPDFLFTLALLAEAHHRLGQHEKAGERIRRAVAVYRAQQGQPLTTLGQERASTRERLWEALAGMGADRELYELSLQEEPSAMTARQLAQSGVAAARCGESAQATQWLAAAITAEPSFSAAAALADALARMRQGAVPAFELDYDFALAPVEPEATALSAGVRARLVSRIWGKDVAAAEATVRSLAGSHDPWARQLLEAVAVRPELPVSVARCAAECLADLGERTGE